MFVAGGGGSRTWTRLQRGHFRQGEAGERNQASRKTPTQDSRNRRRRLSKARGRNRATAISRSTSCSLSRSGQTDDQRRNRNPDPPPGYRQGGWGGGIEGWRSHRCSLNHYEHQKPTFPVHCKISPFVHYGLIGSGANVLCPLAEFIGARFDWSAPSCRFSARSHTPPHPCPPHPGV